jgi:hypothetical protein
VLIPLAAIGATLIAVRPAWRARFGALVVSAAGIGLVGIQLAIGSMLSGAARPQGHYRTPGSPLRCDVRPTR